MSLTSPYHRIRCVAGKDGIRAPEGRSAEKGIHMSDELVSGLAAICTMRSGSVLALYRWLLLQCDEE